MTTDRPHEAVFYFDYCDERAAQLVAASVGVEQGEITGDRTEAAVDRDGATMQVTIRADDLVALRAGANTWTGLVEAAEAVVGV